MRVIIIVQNYPPERGAVRYTEQVARGLARAGHDVTVITGLPHYPTGKPYPGFGRWRTDRRVEHGVQVIRVPMILASNRQPVRRIAGFLSYCITAFAGICVHPRADVIIASVPPPTIAGLGVAASLVHRRRFVALLRDIEPLRLLTIRGLEQATPGRALINAAMWLYRRAQHTVVVHPGERDTLREYGFSADRISVIGHGVDIDAYNADTHLASSTTLPRTPGRMIALYAGTLGHVHALPQLIRAMGSDPVRERPVDLVIVGDGEYRQRCEEMIVSEQVPNVHLHPSVPLDDVPALLRQADILVCSFRNDSEAQLGSKFHEYCAAGKPILVHGRSAAATLVTEIGNGWKCEEGDVDGLCAAFDEYITSTDDWVQRGRRGQEYAHRHFAQEAKNREWAALIRRFATG